MARSARTVAIRIILERLNRIITAVYLVVFLPTSATAGPILDAIRSIEYDLGARVGFYMHDLQTGEIIAYAEGDRFPLNSTFKLLACGALLSRVENGYAHLADIVPLKNIEIVDYSPAIRAYIQAGNADISLDAACAMMLSVSDNTAANIVLAELGGPEGLTAFLQSNGDRVTRLDRWETELNQAIPGDLRDTTTPLAIGLSVENLLLADTLSSTSLATLREWLSHHSVADGLFRAALPPTWSIDDRTGAGGHGSRSIVAVIYPPNREPIVAALFMTETEASFASRNAAAVTVGAAIVAHVVGNM